MMNAQEAAAKVAKLLRLAQSDNPHEAALAAARAQEIMDRYKLTGAALDLEGKPAEDNERAQVFQAPLFDGGSQVATWIARLAVHVARANQCQVFMRSGTLQLVGRPSDAETVRYLFAYLRNEVDRLAARDARGNGRTWANNFRIGCVETIAEALQAQRKATVAAVQAEAATPSALVLVSQSLARLERHDRETEAVMKGLGLRRGSARRSSYDHGAREAGRAAGREVSVSTRGGLRAGYRQLAG